MARYKNVNGEKIPYTAEEEAEADFLSSDAKQLEESLILLRIKRNELLAKTDWTASSDLTMSDEMKTYRQELRDATNGLDTVDKVNAYEFPDEVLK